MLTFRAMSTSTIAADPRAARLRRVAGAARVARLAFRHPRSAAERGSGRVAVGQGVATRASPAESVGDARQVRAVLDHGAQTNGASLCVVTALTFAGVGAACRTKTVGVRLVISVPLDVACARIVADLVEVHAGARGGSGEIRGGEAAHL